MKERLDKLIVDRNLTDSRERAKAFILAGSISVNGETIRKPARLVDSAAEIVIRRERGGYVSRGGVKLERALNVFAVRAAGTFCLDIGASTGGFTDCLLQHGACRVVAVDVGKNQLAYTLRIDPRVQPVEGFNARMIDQLTLNQFPDIVTIDVSFISIRYILLPLKSIVAGETEIICLIKPQFEIERPYRDFSGVVRDKERHMDVLVKLNDFFESSGYGVHGYTFSPIRGPKGNIEYFVHLRKGSRGTYSIHSIERVVENSYSYFRSCT